MEWDNKASGYAYNPTVFTIATQPPDFGMLPSAIALAQIVESWWCMPLPKTYPSSWHPEGHYTNTAS